MVVVIHWVGIIIVGIDTVTIIDIAVTVIVYSIVVTIGGVAKHVRREVRVIVINSGVDNRNYNVAAASR
jgi:hypothetical protein